MRLYNGAGEQPVSEEKGRPKPAAERETEDEKGLLDFCRVPRTRKEILGYLGIASAQYALKRYLTPLVQAGRIRLSNPEHPKSTKQKFQTVE